MGQRMNRSKLFFGQLAGGQKPTEYKSTLSSLYGDVGAGQTEAVKDLATKTEAETKDLTKKLGLTVSQTPEGAKTSLSDQGPFKVSVTPGTPTAVAATPGGTPTASIAPQGATPAPQTPRGVMLRDRTTGESEEEYLKYLSDTLTAAGSSVEEWKKSGLDAKTYLDNLLKKSREGAEAAKTKVQDRLAEDKLGARKVESELEKSAQFYQNQLATEPGTSNIMALAQLSKFFDPRYAGLESGLAQGEVALARQQAVENVEAKQQAEAQRGAAIKEYGEQSKELGQELMKQIGAQEESKRKEFADFYSKGEEGAKDVEKKIKGKITDTQKDIEVRDTKVLDQTIDEISKDNTYSSIDSLVESINKLPEGNHLRKQGNNRLDLIKGKLNTYQDEIKKIVGSSLITPAEKTKRVNEIKNKIKSARSQVAGEMAAFVLDTNHSMNNPHDAMRAINQMFKAGFGDDMSPEDRKKVADVLRSGDFEKAIRSLPFTGKIINPLLDLRKKLVSNLTGELFT